MSYNCAWVGYNLNKPKDKVIGVNEERLGSNERTND